MTDGAASTSKRVRGVLSAAGFGGEVLEFDEGATRSSEMAAGAIGCALGQVVKSLVLVSGPRSVLALTAGDRRVDAAAVGRESGGPRSRFASAEEVRASTGYEVGGVSPFDLPGDLTVLIDDSLSRFDEVFVAAGTPNSMVALSVGELEAFSGGRMARISRAAGEQERPNETGGSDR